MTDRIDGARMQLYARLAGLLYLIVIVAGVFAEIGVRGGMVVAGDAAATANNIMAHQFKYRLGFAAEMIEILCNVPLTLFFYELFKVVNKRLSIIVVFLSMLGTAVGAVNLLNHLAPLKLLGGASFLSVIPVAQLQAQAYLSLQLFELGFAICLVFFGFFCLSVGYLIWTSRFLPRIIGVLLAFEGVCYLANSFIDFLAPQYSDIAFNILAVSAIGEISLTLWLLIKGVNVARWNEQARG